MAKYSIDRKKIFVSVPFGWKSEHDIWANMGETELNYMKEHPNPIGRAPVFVSNYQVSQTIQLNAKKAKHPPLIYLAEAIRRMANCDDVIFGEGWENARGCQVEKLIYDFYIKPTRDENKA